MGVGRVEDTIAAVVADLGVVICVETERGVKGVLVMGESSVRADRVADSTGVLPERRRLSDSCLVRRGTVALREGMMRGARLLGDRGWRMMVVDWWTSVMLSSASSS